MEKVYEIGPVHSEDEQENYDFDRIAAVQAQTQRIRAGLGLVLLEEKGKLLLSPQQVVIRDKKDITGKISQNTIVDQDYPHRTLKHKGIVGSGCSRHMTGNKAYLAEYQDFNGGLVAFGGSKWYITGKGKIKTGKLDFEDVCFVKELQQFNLFSVSQICDKKNKVLFTDSDCLVLSPEFKLPDENQVLLRIPRQNNMYSFNLENIVPLGDVYLQRLFKMTTLVLLVRKESNTRPPVRPNKFSWVFFLRTKDETSGILKDFIRQIENQLNQKVKTIRCDNGIEFKNMDFIEFCGSKGIKREYNNARTPQQNRVAERKNKTLIEAARTMLADSFLPNTFWAEAVSTACYVLNRVLVTKPHNKTPYELVTEAKSAQDYFVLPIWSSYTSTIKSSKAKNEGEKPTKNTDLKTNEKTVDKEDQAFLDELERINRQEKEANDAAEALRKEFAQDTKDLLLQAGAARTSSTNTVNTASTPVSTVSPSGGLSLTDLTNTDQDDYEIPALEDSYDNPNDETIVNDRSYSQHQGYTLFILQLQILGDPKSAVQTGRKVAQKFWSRAILCNGCEEWPSFMAQLMWSICVPQPPVLKILSYPIKVYKVVERPSMVTPKLPEPVLARTPIETQSLGLGSKKQVMLEVTPKTSHINAREELS
ncbi:ribonuclease H-like domain-containing protein [Tanacetum coccineum]